MNDAIKWDASSIKSISNKKQASSCEAIISPPAMFRVLGFPRKVAGFLLRPHGESVCFGNVKFHIFWMMRGSLFDRTIEFPLLSEANSKAALPCYPPPLSPFCLPHPASPACTFLNFNHPTFDTFHSNLSQGYPDFQKDVFPLLAWTSITILNLPVDSLPGLLDTTVMFTWRLSLKADLKPS